MHSSLKLIIQSPEYFNRIQISVDQTELPYLTSLNILYHYERRTRRAVLQVTEALCHKRVILCSIPGGVF
jgi:hypothetical protein